MNPIYEIKGNVDDSTGCICFLGDIVVSGNVEDGFRILAAGNIWIGGTIGSSEVEADGDIVVEKGITGKGEGLLKAGGNIYAKFIENSKVEAKNKVIAFDGISHSSVIAKEIVCTGQKGIISSKLKAKDHLSAEDTVYSGSEILINTASLTLQMDYRNVTFICEGDEIQAIPYRKPENKILSIDSLTHLRPIQKIQSINTSIKSAPKITLEELEESMLPGKLSVEGFLGRDENLKDVLNRDDIAVQKYGVQHEEIASRLELLILLALYREEQIEYDSQEGIFDSGHKKWSVENLLKTEKAKRVEDVDEYLNQYEIEVTSWMGDQDCPYLCSGYSPNYGSSLYIAYDYHGGIDLKVSSTKSSDLLKFPGLIVHLIRAHHFYEGLNSPYRVDPIQAMKFLALI